MPILELTITLTEPDLEPDELEEETNELFNRLREFYDDELEDVNKIQLVPEPESNEGSLEGRGSGYLPEIKVESENLNNTEKTIQYIQEQLPSQRIKFELSVYPSGEKKVTIEGYKDELTPEKIREYLEPLNLI